MTLLSVPEPSGLLLLLALLCSLLPRTSLAQNNSTSVTSSSSPTTTPTTTDCYSNTTLLLQALEAADTTAGSQTFRLCANTVFPITAFALDDQQQPAINAADANDNNDNANTKQSMSPLFLKSNVTIQCGDDGASTNNCTLQGGQTQVVSLPAIFSSSSSSAVDEAAATSSSSSTTSNTVNAAVYGVTFASATETAALLANAGDVTFVDCVFRDHVNVAAVSLILSPTLGLPSTPKADENSGNDGVTNITDHQQQPDSDLDESVSQVMDNVNQFANQFDTDNSSSNNGNRDLSHITFQITLPEDCTMVDFTHDFESTPARLVDLVQCTDFCGPGRYVNITVTSVCTTLDEEGCVNTVDCIVAGCNEDCNVEAGECDCTDKFGQAEDGSLVVTGLCEEVCAAEPVDMATLAPTLSPASTPTSSPTVATTSPTSAPVTAAVPATSSPTSVPVTGDGPATPSTSSNRQRVTFQKCSFLSNKPLPTQSGPSAVVVVDTAFSDLVMEDCYFANNDFSQVNNDTVASTLVESFDSYGVAVLVKAGSTLQMSGTCFLFNDFSGPGTVVVAGDPDPLLYEGVMLNNFGTADDGLTCPFLALVSSLSQSPSTCVEYDAAECGIVPSGATPPATESTSSPVVAGTDEPTTSPVKTPTVSPTSSPTMTSPESPGEEEDAFVCHVCPDGGEMTLPQALVVIPAGFISESEAFVTCDLLEQSITMNSEQVVDICADIQQNYAKPCGCPPIEGDDDADDEEDATTPPAAETTSIPVSESPEEEEDPFVCHICPDGEEITLPHATIIIPAGFISDLQSFVTCDLMERAIVLNSDQVAAFCGLIQQNYAEPCGCSPIEEDDDGEDDIESDAFDLVDEDSSSGLTRRLWILLSPVVGLIVLLL